MFFHALSFSKKTCQFSTFIDPVYFISNVVLVSSRSSVSYCQSWFFTSADNRICHETQLSKHRMKKKHERRSQTSHFLCIKSIMGSLMEQRSVLVQEALKYYGRGLLRILGLNYGKRKRNIIFRGTLTVFLNWRQAFNCLKLWRFQLMCLL